jgi:hypothetical protein
LFSQRLAPRVQHPSTETAPEPADSGKSNAGDFHRFTVEHGHTSVVENLGNHFRLSGFYPGERARIPATVMENLMTRLRAEANTAGPDRLCRGTLLSRQQYLVDIQERGLRDARLEERVRMDERDIAAWTEAIWKEE